MDTVGEYGVSAFGRANLLLSHWITKVRQEAHPPTSPTKILPLENESLQKAQRHGDSEEKAMITTKWFLVIAFLASVSYMEGEDVERSSFSGSGRISRKDLASQVELTLTNELPFQRKAEPVTCGVPLARGFARRADELTLLDSNGRAVSVQILTTSNIQGQHSALGAPELSGGCAS